jgi:GTP-binding protein
MDGEKGRGQFRDGARGEDLVLQVPVGTVAHNLETGESIELVKIGERQIVAQGGLGGRGNFFFRSPVNTSPQEYEEGKPGERFKLRLELKLIADVGLIGLPNAGKSSLLNALTAAHAKVGDYPFTTLEPNLGSYHGLILADIPGLIEGASTGKGLGTKFLRHIERTRVLFHLVAADSSKPLSDYRTIRRELARYHKDLAKKEEYVFISKSDMASDREIKMVIAKFAKADIKAVPISILDEESMKMVADMLTAILKEKEA